MKKSNPDHMRDYDRMLFSEGVISLFWAIIHDKRKRGKYTLQNVSDSAGIDKAKVSRDFSGTPNWQLNTMVDYGSALGVDLEIRARDRTTGRIITSSGPLSTPAIGSGGVRVTSGQDPSLKLIRLGDGDPQKRSA